ncbi:MAG: MMPL family transporter, partial [Dehalococcoidia bacterium]|nr:MMPL family transporter [Dehalococcoidia bacterium]
MKLSVQGIAGFGGRHPWWMMLGWVLVLFAAGGLVTTLLESAIDGEQGPTQTLEFERAQNLINERFGEVDGTDQQAEEDTGPPTLSELVLIVSETSKSGDPAFDQRVSAFGDALEAAQVAENIPDDELPVLVGHFSDYQGQVSQDGTALLTSVNIYDASTNRISTLLHVTEDFSTDGFEVYMMGDASIEHVFLELAESDLVSGETIGVGIAIIILALVFGAVVAAFIPIILAIVAIFTALGFTSIVGQFMDLNEFVPNMISMMGLAVGIDYSLFILSRYREERERGLEKQEAIEAAGGSAGRAVVFSGLTVVLALLGMLIVPERTFQAFGISAILVVFAAVITGSTLLPAFIGVLGDRVNAVRAPLPLTLGLFIVGAAALSVTAGFGPDVIMVSGGVILVLIVLTAFRRFSKSDRSFGLGQDRFADPDVQTGFWYTITVRVMKRPFVSMAVAATILLVLSYFYIDLQKGTSGLSLLPEDLPARKDFELLDEKFGFGSDAPALVAIEGDVGSEEFTAALANLEQAITEDAGLQPPEVRVEPSVGFASFTARIPGDSQNQVALNTIRRLRTDLIPEAFAAASVPE